MTEERKIQLGVGVDATGAKEGLGEIKAAAQDMAQSIAQSGQAAGAGLEGGIVGSVKRASAATKEVAAAAQSAGKGISGIGDGAAAGSAKLDAATRNMISSIQRQTAALEAGSKSGARYFEVLAQQRGIPLDALRPYLAQLEAVSAKQKQATAGMTEMAAQAKQTAAAIGSVAAPKPLTTSLGATNFANLDKATTSLGAVAVEAQRATREVNALDRAMELIGPLKDVTTTGARPLGGLRGAIAQRDVEEAARRALDPRLAGSAASATAAATAAVGAAAAKAKPEVNGLEMSTKQLNFALRQVPAQMTDIVISLQSGQRPMQVLLQQGGQLKDLFGGIAPAARALGGYVLGLVNPYTVAAAAVAGFAVALYRAESAARELNTLQVQLAATGRRGLFSNDELRGFVNELALLPGVTRASAQAIVSELSKVHEIGGGMFRDLAKLSVDFARATGTDAPAATKTLTKAFADPAKGAKELDAILGTLSSTTLLTTERLQRQGDIVGARRVLYAALEASIKGLADNAMTPLQKSTNELGNAWERAMQKMDQSTGLRNVNALLGQVIGSVTWLTDHADRIGGLGTIALGSVPGLQGATIGGALGSAARQAIFGPDSAAPGKREASGKVTPLPGTAAAAGGEDQRAAADKSIKLALDAGKSFQSEAGRIKELREQRTQFNSALAQSIELYGKNSEQAKKLRDIVAGIDERIAAAGKKGRGGNEAQQVLDAQLQQSLKASRDALERERDNIQFSQRFLQSAYQAGEISLRDFYEQKRKAIAEGVAAELVELDKERVAVRAHFEATKRTSPKDQSALVRDETRLREIDAQAEKLRIDGARQQVLANQEAGASFKQLTEQVLNYRANLLQLQGDEVGAARLRAQAAIEQARVLARQASGAGAGAVDVDGFARGVSQQNAITEAKNRTSLINQQLQLEEDRIWLAVQRGTTGELAALVQLGAARARRVGELQQEAEALEKLAKERPLDIQLNIDATRARLELDRLKADLDPLKEKFDNIFKGAGASFLEDLMNGVNRKDALKNLFGSIGREINSIVSKELATSIFSDKGALGGAGGLFARLFGGKDRAAAAAGAAPALDTSAVSASLSNLQASGIDPTTAAMVRLQQAADGAAGALASPVRSGVAVGQPLPPIGGTTGDFARFDRSSGTTGEQSVLNLFRDAGKSSADLGEANLRAASSALQLAQAAARGGNALGLLPAIVQAYQSAVAASRLSSAGGGFGGLFGSLFGGSSASSVGSALLGLSGAVDGVPYLFSRGGFTGRGDPRKPAGIVHEEEYVFSAPAVRAIGVGNLERMHRKAKGGAPDTGMPGYADGGFVVAADARSPVMVLASGSGNLTRPRYESEPKPVTTTITQHYTVQVMATPGMSREAAMNQGRDIQRGMQTTAARRARNS